MPDRDPSTRRYPCPWCERPDRWPGACAEDAGDSRCTGIIKRRCMAGDHRRCGAGRCTFGIRWHDEVREAGVAAATAAGRTWAIVSTIGNKVQVIGTEDNLGRARVRLAGTLWRAGRHADPEGFGLVYVVRVTDGGFV